MLEDLASFAEASQRARERRLAAIPAVFHADAAQLEHDAERLETKAAKVEARSKPLLEELRTIEDWAYVPAPPVIPERMIGEQQGGASVIVDARGPRHERLRLEAQGKRSEAAQIRMRQPHRAGAVEADNLEDLLAAIFAACPCSICRGRAGMRIQPAIADVVTWSEKVIEKERRRRARTASTEDAFVSADAPMRLLLEWRAGVIDQTQSHIIQSEPPEVLAWPVDSTPAAFDPRKRTPLGTMPYNTGPTDVEIRREAVATGKTVEEIAEQWGVPVPSGTEPEATAPTPYAIRREAAITGESIEAVAKRFGVPVPKELAQVEVK
jgi:hypothetical protein